MLSAMVNVKREGWCLSESEEVRIIEFGIDLPAAVQELGAHVYIGERERALAPEEESLLRKDIHIFKKREESNCKYYKDIIQ